MSFGELAAGVDEAEGKEDKVIDGPLVAVAVSGTRARHGKQVALLELLIAVAQQEPMLPHYRALLLAVPVAVEWAEAWPA